MRTLTLSDNEAAILRALVQFHVDNTAPEDTAELLAETLGSEFGVAAAETWFELCEKVGATT